MWKSFPKWKKILFLIVTAIVITRIIYIVGMGEIERQYQTSCEIDVTGAQEISCQNVVQKFRSDRDRLNSLELMFNGIAEDKLGFLTLAITSENELIYQTNISLVNVNNLEWKQVFINMPPDSGKEYEISVIAQDCTQVPNLFLVPVESAAPEAIESYSEGAALSGQFSLKYGYLSEPLLSDKFMSSLVWLMFLLLFFLFLLKFEQIMEQCKKIWVKLCSMGNKEVICIVLELIFSLIIIGSSGIEFQESTKVVLYLISVVSAWKSEEKWKYVRDVINKPWKKTGLYLVYFYGAFALVGQRILIYPLNQKVTVEGLFILGITMLWMVPVINSVCYWLEWMSRRFVLENRLNFKGGGIKTSWFVCMSVLFLLLPAVLNLYANNPGISSEDTAICMVRNAHNIRGMENWHPAFYCMVSGLILKVWDSTYAVIFSQYFFWVYVITEGMLYLRKKNVKDIFLLVLAFLLGINAANFLFLNTIWKDIPYALSVVWVLLLLTKLIVDFEEYNRKWYIYIELMIALLGTYFYRKNGMVTFIFIVVSMLVLFYKNLKVWGTVVITIMLIITVKGPVYSYFEVVDTGRWGMYIGLSQDILGVYYAGGEVSEETLQMINVMTDKNNAEYIYNPTWANQSYDLAVEPIEFIKNYLNTFIKNPVTMIRALVDREDMIWDIFEGNESRVSCVNYTGTMDGRLNWNNYYSPRRYNSFYPWMLNFTTYTTMSQWMRVLQWRSGFFTLVGIIAIFLIICKKGIRRYFAIVSPLVGHIFSLLLSTGWSDFRYFWPLNLMNLSILTMSVILLQDDK